MARAQIAYRNLADGGVARASSHASLTPASNVLNPHVARKWRGTAGAAEFLQIDLGALVAIDTVMVRALNLTSAGTTRIRLATVDNSGTAGDAYDSGPMAGLVDPAYAYLVTMLPAAVTARYLRIDMAEPGAAYIEAGRVFAGVRTGFPVNFSYGWQRQWVDPSKKTKSRGGQTHIDIQDAYRTIDLTFDRVTQGQRDGVIEDIDRVNGSHEDVLFLTDPDSPNLGRDSIWGLITETTPVSQNYFDNYVKSYKLEERL